MNKTIKIIVMGDRGVGKTSIIDRYFDNFFEDMKKKTNANVRKKINYSFTYEVLEVSILESFHEDVAKFLEGANTSSIGWFIVFDVNLPGSFDIIDKLYKSFYKEIMSIYKDDIEDLYTKMIDTYEKKEIWQILDLLMKIYNGEDKEYIYTKIKEEYDAMEKNDLITQLMEVRTFKKGEDTARIKRRYKRTSRDDIYNELMKTYRTKNDPYIILRNMIKDRSHEKLYGELKKIDKLKFKEDLFPDLIPIVLGNKIDKENQRIVSQKRARAWCEANGRSPYFEVSAKDNINVYASFGVIEKKKIEQKIITDYDLVANIPFRIQDMKGNLHSICNYQAVRKGLNIEEYNRYAPISNTNIYTSFIKVYMNRDTDYFKHDSIHLRGLFDYYQKNSDFKDTKLLDFFKITNFQEYTICSKDHKNDFKSDNKHNDFMMRVTNLNFVGAESSHSYLEFPKKINENQKKIKCKTCSEKYTPENSFLTFDVDHLILEGSTEKNPKLDVAKTLLILEKSVKFMDKVEYQLSCIIFRNHVSHQYFCLVRNDNKNYLIGFTEEKSHDKKSYLMPLKDLYTFLDDENIEIDYIILEKIGIVRPKKVVDAPIKIKLKKIETDQYDLRDLFIHYLKHLTLTKDNLIKQQKKLVEELLKK